MSQCESTFKMLRALGAGRSTITEIADVTGLSNKTVRRYIQMLSIYFRVQEDVDGHQHYYWLDEIPTPAQSADVPRSHQTAKHKTAAEPKIVEFSS